MEARDLVSARAHLQQAAEVAGEGDREEVRRLEGLLDRLEVFWQAVRQGVADLKPSDQIPVEGAPQTVVEVGGDALTVRAGEKEQRYTVDALPAPLALALASRVLPVDSPSSILARATFLVFDPHGDLALARRLCLDASNYGEPAPAVLKELDRALKTRPELPLSPAPAQPESAARAEPAPPESAAQPKPAPKRLPVPEEAAQRVALAQIQEIFKDGFSEAGDLEGKQQLSKTLLEQGLATKDDPVGRFVLLALARDLSAESGAAGQFLQAAAILSKQYEVDFFKSVSKLLGRTSKQPRPPEANKTMGRSTLMLATQALAHDDFSAAAELAEAAILMARKARDTAVVKAAVELNRRLKPLEKHFEAYAAAGETLKRQPDDPDANEARGVYLCLIKRDWAQGLPLVAKSNNAAWKDAAEAELGKPTQPDAIIALGDHWWKMSASADVVLRPAIRERAAYWYRRALRGLTGLTRTRIEHRLSEVSDSAAEPRR
jgi:hypothetical protein